MKLALSETPKTGFVALQPKLSNLQRVITRVSSIKLFACWVIVHAFVDLTFSKLTFSKSSFRNTMRVSNGLNSDQVQNNPGVSLNSLEMSSADDLNCS